MATRESQSLQIALMIFALLAVLLAVTTYVGFKQYGDQRKENATLTDRMRDRDRAVREMQEEANRYKEMIGFSTDDELAKIEEKFKADMKQFAANFPEEKQDYHAVLEYFHNEVGAISEREAAARDREQSLKNQLAKVQADAAKQVQQYQSQMKQCKDDLTAETKKFEQRRQKFEAQMAQLDKQLEARRKEIADLKTAKATQIGLLKDKVGKLQRRIFRLTNEKKELLSTEFDVADGKIVRVNQGSDTVWINLGRSDGLMPRVTFSVYDAQQNNAATAAKKASIEVTRVLGRNLAEARITSDTLSNPIVRGDQIYSPIWQRGRAESFALAGFIDINGDGKSDLDAVRDLIKINGGTIDASIGKDGQIVGKMTVNTRYLVRGKQPKVGMEEGQDPAAVKKAIQSYSEMNQEAKDLGITTISVDEFLDRMGWRPTQRLVRLGHDANPDDFRAPPPPGARHGATVGPAEGFRRRQPPQVSF